MSAAEEPKDLPSRPREHNALPGRTELDPVAILQTLGIRRPGSIVPVHGGFDARIWRIEYGRGSCFALRVLRPRQRETAEREVTALAAAQRAGLPVPVLHAYGSWNEHPALLLGWCTGKTLAAALGEQPWRAGALGLAFGRAQARIHQIAAPPGLSNDWIAWAGDDQKLAERLQREQMRSSLLHLDYHPLNVLVDGNRISCILDWANARAGDPRADIARSFTILRIEPLGPHASPALEFGRRALTWFWRRGYRQIAGRIDEGALFRAWAGAVMQRDLAHRVEQPDSWWRQADMQRLERWTDRRRRAAGL